MKAIIAIVVILLFSTFTKSVFASSNVVINESVAHPSSGNTEWIELYNPDKIDLSSYFIDDDTSFTSDSGSSTIKQLSALNAADSIFPYIETTSFLNNNGDYVVLFDGSGNIIDEYQYTKDPGADVAIGRSPDGTGSFNVLAQSSKGAANSSYLPTNTPIPPTATLTPTPTKVPTPTPTQTPTPTPKMILVSPVQITNSTAENVTPPVSVVIADNLDSEQISSQDGEILGTQSAVLFQTPSPVKTKPNKILVKGTSTVS